MKEEKRKEFFQIIQGKLPSEKEMRNKLPGQFKNLKTRLEKLNELDNEDIQNTRRNFEVLMSKYGENLERYLFFRR